jgi:succinate dehydrogenase / fumarate reductase membrane anchor subunit
VRGHGAARSGTHHFITQRASAAALVILIPWFVISAALFLGRGYDSDFGWIANPLNAIGLILLVLAAFYHMRLGLQVVIEDYISKPLTKTLLLLVNTFVAYGAAVAAIFAILRISFGS